MDIVHAIVTLEDQFSGCKATKTQTVSAYTFEKMKAGIGTVFSQFDKRAQIRYTWKVVEVKQV